jgi:hypothetical protein
MKVTDLPITITPAINDFTINDLANGLTTQKTTWAQIKALLGAGFSAHIEPELP